MKQIVTVNGTNVTVINQADDGLTGETFLFSANPERNKMVLDSYFNWDRKTRRHSPAASKAWYRLERRKRTIEETAIPMTDEIFQVAKAAYLKQLSENMVFSFAY